MGHKAFPQRHTGHLIETPTHLPWEGGAGACLTGSLTQLGGHRARTQARTCLLSVLAPPWPCLVPREGGDWRSGRTGETTPPCGLRPGRGPLATSTRPSGLQRCFPSGVTMVPKLLCSTQPPPPRPQPDPGQGVGIPCSQSRVAWASRSGGRAGSRGIPGLEAAGGVGAAVTSGGGSWAVGWGGGCLRQEGPLGQGRVGVKGGGEGPR